MSTIERDFFGFTGKTGIVWGGGDGIGAATVRLLARFGAQVAIVGRNAAKQEALLAEVRAMGTRAIAVTCDVRDEAEVNATVDTTIDQLGLPTLSVNVIGVAQFGALINMSTETFDDQIALNLKPMFLIGRKLACTLRDAGEPGSLVFVGSITGQHGAAEHAIYGAAKSAMMGLTRSMALEWGQYGIRVNCIAPGATHTTRIQPTPDMIESFARRLPSGRMATVDEIGAAIIMALSPAVTVMTGSTINVDGGWMAGSLMSDANGNLPRP